MDPLAATETDSTQSDTEARTAQVAEVLLTYLDGLYHSDTARLAAVFHPAAVYATATGGELLHLTMDEYLSVVEQREAPATRGEVRQDRVVSIDFAGPVTALARVECADRGAALHRLPVAGPRRRSVADHGQGLPLRHPAHPAHGGVTVPYVNVQITREGATPTQKAQIIEGVTQLLVDVLGKDPATTFVVIQEVELEDWGIGGLPVVERRRRRSAD